MHFPSLAECTGVSCRRLPSPITSRPRLLEHLQGIRRRPATSEQRQGPQQLRFQQLGPYLQPFKGHSKSTQRAPKHCHALPRHPCNCSIASVASSTALPQRHRPPLCRSISASASRIRATPRALPASLAISFTLILSLARIYHYIIYVSCYIITYNIYIYIIIHHDISISLAS